MRGPTLATLLASPALGGGRLAGPLAVYAARHGLEPASPGTLLADRGFGWSGVLWRRPGPDGTREEHQLLVIREPGGAVPEKRHFRLLGDPGAPAEPRLLIGEERVTVLAGVLVLEGADVPRPVTLRAGAAARSYACEVDGPRRAVRWFQDRHALRAGAASTAVVFRQRTTTLGALARLLGADHPDVVEIQARGVAPPPGRPPA